MKLFCFLMLFFNGLFSHYALELIEPLARRGFSPGNSVCVVFVCDENYFIKFKRTLTALRTEGKYLGDVSLITTGNLDPKEVKKECSDPFLTILRFPAIPVSEKLKSLAGENQNIVAQMQKFHVFQTFFKNWNYVFYIDVGMHIHGDVNQIIDLKEEATILAHSNCFPTYVWDQKHEFIDDKSLRYKQMLEEYDLHNDYFQSGIMLFDTELIDEDTVGNLVGLSKLYPYGPGDQSYISLYFCQIYPAWKQIQLNKGSVFFYDYHPRFRGSYIMHKYCNGAFPCVICEPDRANPTKEELKANASSWQAVKNKVKSFFRL